MKKISFMDVLTVLFMVGCIVVSVALVNESYVADEDMGNVMRMGLRIVGFLGCVGFPYVFGQAVTENRLLADDEWEDVYEPDEWNATADMDYTEWD